MKHHHQKGQALYGLLLLVGVLAVGLVGYLRYQNNMRVQRVTNEQGQKLAQFAVGLRGFVADIQNGSITLPSNPITMNGVDWLKGNSCTVTTPPFPAPFFNKNYIPCSYDGGAVGQNYQSRITYDPGTGLVEVRTSYMASPAYTNGGSVGSFAARIAQAARAQQTIPASGMFFNVISNAPVTASATPRPDLANVADRGRVTMIVSNAPSNDIWLRVDGTNQMLANLNVGGNSIYAANQGHFSGQLQVDDGIVVSQGTPGASALDVRGSAIVDDMKVTNSDASNGGQMASQALYKMQVYQGGSPFNVAKPDCSLANAGTSTPVIFAALQNTGSAGEAVGADALYQSGVTVTNNGSYWTVTPRIEAVKFSLTSGSAPGGGTRITLVKNKYVQAAATSPSVIVMTKCS